MNDFDAPGQGAIGLDRQARGRAGLAILNALALALLSVALTKDPNPPFVPPPQATSDVDVYRRIVNRVRAGESYYAASHVELRSHRYPTRSVLNWRTPTFAWFLASRFGTEWGPWILVSFAVAGLVMSCRDMVDDYGVLPAVVGGIFLVGSSAWSLGDETYLFNELWAGMLILFSVGCYHREQTAWAVATGLLAAFYRELALPYCLVCLGLATWHGRKREAAAWVVGLALFLAFMLFHAYQVHSRISDVDTALAGGWLRLGGFRFILTTAHANVLLMLLPMWFTAVFVALSCLGLADAKDECSLRITLAAGFYLTAFSIFGNPFNFYWGFVNAPLLALGIARAPHALVSLLSMAFPRLEVQPVGPNASSSHA
jgi:hypothetical protein